MRYESFKRSLDLAILVVAHVALLPLWALLWASIPLLIWLDDRGPVFYRQSRVGRYGKEFTVLKFRTMIPDADKHGDPWTVENDPRVTRFGRILRRTALDELPELLNILKGDMSFVGPRAIQIGEQRLLERKIPGFADRLAVRPGLTGLAQVYNLTDDGWEKLRHDRDYIARMSLRLDLWLLAFSVLNTLATRWDRRSGKSSVQGTDSPRKAGD